MYAYAGNSPIVYTDPFGRWKQVDCTMGGKAGTCWASDRADDTYASLAQLIGANSKMLADYFQNGSITMGQVFITSGYNRWAAEQWIGDRFNPDRYIFEPPMGGGLRTVGKAGGGLLSRVGSGLKRWLGFGKKGSAAAPALRQAYEAEVKSLAQKAAEMKAAGHSVEEIAIQLHAERRALGVIYKDMTPPELLKTILERNVRVYGDELGPSIEWLRARGKSWEDIIKSASKPGGKDLDF